MAASSHLKKHSTLVPVILRVSPNILRMYYGAVCDLLDDIGEDIQDNR